MSITGVVDSDALPVSVGLPVSPPVLVLVLVVVSTAVTVLVLLSPVVATTVAVEVDGTVVLTVVVLSTLLDSGVLPTTVEVNVICVLTVVVVVLESDSEVALDSGPPGWMMTVDVRVGTVVVVVIVLVMKPVRVAGREKEGRTTVVVTPAVRDMEAWAAARAGRRGVRRRIVADGGMGWREDCLAVGGEDVSSTGWHAVQGEQRERADGGVG